MKKKSEVLREGFKKGLKEAERVIECVLNEAGYYAFSMSNNAKSAYEKGKKPLSKWTKADIISAAQDLGCPEERLQWLKKQTLPFLKKLLLLTNEWHHTSSHYNITEFYEIDEDKLMSDQEDWEEYVEIAKEDLPVKSKKQEVVRKRGKFFWITWEGTRNHPKARHHELLDAYVEEKGCFYNVYDKDGNFVVKKKIDSNGTEFVEKVK